MTDDGISFETVEADWRAWQALRPEDRPKADPDMARGLARLQGQPDRALAYYRRLAGDPGALRKATAVEYRCESHGCLLARVVNAPGAAEDGGPVFVIWFPPMTLSPERNHAESTPEARAKRTTDGGRRWVGHADKLMDWATYHLNCDHLRALELPGLEAVKDATRRAGKLPLDAGGR
jgi:hypothetical protein